MKEQIIQNSSLEALSKKSFKKYLKTMIKDKEEYLEKCTTKGYRYLESGKQKIEYEYNLLCQVLDDYVYYQERKKDLKKIKENHA